MSTFEEIEYYFEASGFNYGPQTVMVMLLLVSTVLGGLVASCLLKKSEVDEEQKAARKALSQMLNNQSQEKTTSGKEDIHKYAQEDDMFDVPLNDDHTAGYVGPDLHSDMVA